MASGSVVSMEPKMGPSARIGNYRPAPAVTPERWLAAKLGRTEGGVHQLLYSAFRCGVPLNDLTALCITAFTETDNGERFTRWVAPIREALGRIRQLPLSQDLIRDVQRIDLEEDLIEAEYHAAPTAENAKRWVTWIDRCVQGLLELRAALVTKHNLEQQ